jgi:hypothetical protein
MKTALSILAALSLSACAAQQQQPPRAYSAADASAMSDVVAVEAGSCFRMSQIRNHTKVDDHTLLVSVGARDSVYRWEMSGACLAGATSSDPLILEPASGGDIICKPIDLQVKVKVGAIASPCILKSITRLTPDQVAVLPKGQRP